MKTEVGRSLKCFYVSGKSLSISILIHSTHVCYMVVKPLCFVVMPFGKKPDSGGSIINFDSVYEKVISPAVKKLA